jgi:hypothetical protein
MKIMFADRKIQLEELLIDFCELDGEHSGANMGDQVPSANAVGSIKWLHPNIAEMMWMAFNDLSC